jgi:hypothetical protein
MKCDALRQEGTSTEDATFVANGRVVCGEKCYVEAGGDNAFNTVCEEGSTPTDFKNAA